MSQLTKMLLIVAFTMILPFSTRAQDDEFSEPSTPQKGMSHSEDPQGFDMDAKTEICTQTPDNPACKPGEAPKTLDQVKKNSEKKTKKSKTKKSKSRKKMPKKKSKKQ